MVDAASSSGPNAGERSSALILAAGLALAGVIALWLRRTGVIVPWGGRG